MFPTFIFSSFCVCTHSFNVNYILIKINFRNVHEKEVKQKEEGSERNGHGYFRDTRTKIQILLLLLLLFFLSYVLGIKHVLACSSFGHASMCVCVSVCWCLMQFVCTVHLCVPFELACVVYSSFNESHRMRQHSYMHSAHTDTRNHMRCSACECAHNCKCECVSKATYAFVHFPAIAVAAAAAAVTSARIEYTSPCAPCKHTANNNPLLQQISDF